MPERTECDFCVPESEYLFGEIQYPDPAYIKLRDAMEVLGDTLNCGKSKLECTPLRIIKLRINKMEEKNAKRL